MNAVACRHMMEHVDIYWIYGCMVNIVSVLCVRLLGNPQMLITDTQIRLHSE